MTQSLEATAPEETVKHEQQIHDVKEALLSRFGKTVDLDTMEIKQLPWEELSLLGNCGEVSRITAKTMGGTVTETIYHEHDAKMYYKDDSGEKRLIADGNTMAIHSYVVDGNNRVWDPTLDIWGSIEAPDYVARLTKE